MTEQEMDVADVDRGRAWVVLGVVYSAVLCVCTIMYMNGLYLAAMVEYYNEDLTKTSMVGALNSALLCLLAPVVSVFIDTYSSRICMVVGGFLLSMSYFVSFFFKSVDVFIITIGILGGVGNSFAGIPPSVLLAYHFDRWRNIFISFKEVVGGIGMFLASPVLFGFISMFGINGSFLIVSGLALQICVCGLLCTPNSEEKKIWKLKCNSEMENKDAHSNKFLRRVKASTMLSLNLCKNISIMLFMLSTLTWNVIASAVSLHLPRYMIATGFDDFAVITVMTIFALCNTLGRMCAASTTGKQGLDSYILHVGILGVLSLSAALFPFYGKWTLAGFLFSGLCGFYSGGATALMVTITIGMVGVEKLTSAYGLAFFFCGAGMLVGPPLFGVIYETTGSYDYSFMTLGFVGLLGVIAGLVAFKDKYSLDITQKLIYEVPLDYAATSTSLLEKDKMDVEVELDSPCEGYVLEEQ